MEHLGSERIGTPFRENDVVIIRQTGLELQQSAPQPTIDSMMGQPTAKVLIDAGMPSALVRKALENHLKWTGTLFIDTERLYEECIKRQEESKSVSVPAFHENPSKFKLIRKSERINLVRKLLCF